MEKILFVIANKDFNDIEFETPYKKLMEAGYDVVVSAGQEGKAVGRFGLVVDDCIDFRQLDPAEYKAIVFIGGNGAYSQYLDDQEYLKLAQYAGENSILGAICITPTIISDSGIFKGKKVTGWDDGKHTQLDHIASQGGIITDTDVVTDGNIVTANGPQAADKFGEELIEQLRSN